VSKLSYKTLLIIFISLLIAIVVLWKFVLPKQQIKAAWWNETWDYRQTISITNSSGSNQTNTQVKIFTNYDLSSLVTAGKLQSNLNDLRFTDINGNLIKYWIEDSTNNSVDIWGFIPSSPTSGTSIYMYYGNSSANAGKTITGSIDTPGISCYAIKLSGASTNGSYYIDPTGQEISDKFPTYCDITVNGGGWTLMMKANGSSATFNYDATYWTTSNTLNPDNTDITNSTEAKYNSFNILSINEIRATWPQTGHTMLNTVSLTTPLTLFQTTLDLGPTMTQFDYTNFPYQTGYQSYGFNLICASAKSVRWGWMFNNETICSSNDVTAGIGLKTTYSTSHGGWVGCCESTGKIAGGYPYNVLIWGRESTVAVPANIIFSSPTTEELSPAPIAYWKFDEGVGTTTMDYTNNSNTGTITGATWQSEDQCISGKCLYFNGFNSNNKVDLGTSIKLNPANFSISAWIKADDASSNYGYIFSNDRDCCGTYNGFSLFIQGGKLIGDIWNSTITNIVSNRNISSNQWTHINFTYDGSSMKLYINGVLDKSVNYSGGVGSPASFK